MPFTNYSDNAILLARIEALELAFSGRLTNLPANTVLGSAAGGNANALSAAQARTLLEVPSNTDSSESTNTTTGGAVFPGGVGIAKNLNVGGYSKLGDNVALKFKKISITTPGTAGGQTNVPHGVNASKILCLLGGYVDQFGQFITWSSLINNQTINVFTSGSSDVYCNALASTVAAALGRPGTIIIIYES